MTDWSNAVGVVCITALIVLCLGTPDILDGIIKRVNNVECPTVLERN